MLAEGVLRLGFDNLVVLWDDAGMSRASARADGIIGGHGEAVGRIVALYRSAGPAVRALGAAWYAGARFDVQAMADASGRSAHLVADVVAVLSPRCRWDIGLAAAATLLDDADAIPVGPLHANIAKAWGLLGGGDSATIVRGPKVSRFARAIDPTRRHDGSVVCDVWAQRAAAGRPLTESEGKCLSGEPGYAVVERVYREAARRLGRPAHVVQATCWVAVRGSAE